MPKPVNYSYSLQKNVKSRVFFDFQKRKKRILELWKKNRINGNSIFESAVFAILWLGGSEISPFNKTEIRSFKSSQVK